MRDVEYVNPRIEGYMNYGFGKEDIGNKWRKMLSLLVKILVIWDSIDIGQGTCYLERLEN